MSDLELSVALAQCHFRQNCEQHIRKFLYRFALRWRCANSRPTESRSLQQEHDVNRTCRLIPIQSEYYALTALVRERSGALLPRDAGFGEAFSLAWKINTVSFAHEVDALTGAVDLRRNLNTTANSEHSADDSQPPTHLARSARPFDWRVLPRSRQCTCTLQSRPP